MREGIRTMYATLEYRWMGLNTAVHLLVLLTLLNALDVCFTTYLIQVYGYEVEANAWMRDLMMRFDSPFMMLVPKVSLLLILWGSYFRLNDDHRIVTPRRFENTLIGVNVFYFGVILWSAYLSGRTPVVANAMIEYLSM